MNESLAASTDPIPLRWGTFTNPPEGHASAAVEPARGDGKEGLRLRSPDESSAGANSVPLPRLAGRLRFEYRAGEASQAGDNLTFHAIPLNAGEVEEGAAGRTTYTVPKAHADGKLRVGAVEYNYLGGKAAQVIFGPRVNEGGSKGPGELWVGRVWWEPLPARLKILQFGSDAHYFGRALP